MGRVMLTGLLSLWLVPVLTAQDPARYRGRDGTAWIETLTSESDRETTRQASIALGALAKDDPALVTRMLELANTTTVARVRRAITWCLQGAHPSATPGLIPFLRDPDAEIRANAARSLGAIGPGAAAAVPALLEMARTHRASEAPYALGKIGGVDAAKELVRLLPRFPTPAARALEQIGRDAVPALLGALDNPRLRTAATDVLLRIAPTDARVLLAVEAHIPAGDSKSRWRLLRARLPREPELALDVIRIHRKAVGTKARWRGPLIRVHASMIPHLAKGLDDVDPWVRRQAAELLCNLRPPEPEAARHLAPALEDEDAAVRRAAVAGLLEMKTAGAICAAALRTVTKDRDPDVRRLAILALGAVAPADPDTLSTLRATADAHEADRPWAALALARILDNGPERSLRMKQAVATDDRYVRWWADELFRKLEAKHRQPAIGRIIETLSAIDTTDKARATALWSLSKLGPEAAPALPHVLTAIKSSHWESKRAAMYALAAIGAAAKDAVPALIEMFQRGEMPEECLHALGGAGAGAPDSAVPLLIRTLGHRYQNYQRAAGKALGRIGAPAIPALLQAFATEPPGAENTGIRHFAIEAFREAPAELARPALEKAFAHEDPRIAGGALRAFAHLHGRVPDGVFQGHVERAIGHSHWFIRASAADVAWWLDDEALLKPLLSDPDRYVRRKARQAVNTIHRRRE